MSDAEQIGRQIGERIKALKAAAKPAESPVADVGEAAKPVLALPPVVNVAPAAVTVNVPEALPPVVTVEAPVITIEPPIVNVAAPVIDMAPIADAMQAIADAVASLRADMQTNTKALGDLARAQLSEKRLIIEDGKPVGVRAVPPVVH